MSTRYRVELIPAPEYVLSAYRARQTICGQYASWAAEMFMVHINIADFFWCEDESLHRLCRSLEEVARKRGIRRAQLGWGGVGVFAGQAITIFLDFKVGDGSGATYLRDLHEDVLDLLESVPGAASIPKDARESYWPHLALLLNARLHPAVCEEAVEFSTSVVKHLQVPNSTNAWRLWFVKYESDAAGEDWSDGSWAADLRWAILGSFPL